MTTPPSFVTQSRSTSPAQRLLGSNSLWPRLTRIALGAFLFAVASTQLCGCALLQLYDDDGKSPQSELDRYPSNEGGYGGESARGDQNARTEAAERSRMRIDRGLSQRDLVPGMDMSEVQTIWGTPIEVEVAGNPEVGNQRWIYSERTPRYWGNQGARIVYFENGHVVGWDTASR